MKPGEFIALSACTMMLTALGIDIMLPVFADLRVHFGLSSDSTATAQIITFFILGQTAQIIFGILSDRFGRLAILRMGFPLYIVGGVAAAFSPTLSLMFLARFAAGVGASAVFMTTIAGVRDRFVGDQMARTMSLIFTIFLFTPIVAPFLGLAILSVSSWQMVFLTPPMFAVIIFIWSLRLEESLPIDRRSRINWKITSAAIRRVVTNSSALALEPMGDSAGIASAVYGTFFFFIGATLGAVISHEMVHGVFPLVISFFVIGIVALVLAFSDRRAL